MEETYARCGWWVRPVKWRTARQYGRTMPDRLSGVYHEPHAVSPGRIDRLMRWRTCRYPTPLHAQLVVPHRVR